MDSIGTERAWMVTGAAGFLGSHVVEELLGNSATRRARLALAIQLRRGALDQLHQQQVRGTCNIDSCHQHSASPTAIGAGDASLQLLQHRRGMPRSERRILPGRWASGDGQENRFPGGRTFAVSTQ